MVNVRMKNFLSFLTLKKTKRLNVLLGKIIKKKKLYNFFLI